jgi:hypothetical protein
MAACPDPTIKVARMVEDSSVLIGLGVFMGCLGWWWLGMFWFDRFSDSLDFDG